MTGFLQDPLTQLAFAVYENKGVYALLLGSGLSRAAGIPTGWEITLNLVRRVAVAEQVEEQPDWEAWYRQKTGKDPQYSALVEELGAFPAERRSILDSYIEPTEEDLEAKRKVPTVAHRAIADLVGAGYIRVIVTANFDRLMENALRERAIEPTIVASVDALRGAEPPAHSHCYILKLHGDYKDARILNTEAELSGYPAEYDRLLDRILDEYGLIVCGWSGEWDNALRAAILRAPNRRYAMYWATVGDMGGRAQELVNHRAARVIRINDADDFFEELGQRITTLQETHRQNPLSVEVLVASTKRLVATPAYRIQLHDLLADETGRVIERLEGPDLGKPQSWDKATFQIYVKRYEAAIEALACMCGVLGRWGDGSEQPNVRDIMLKLWAHSEAVRDGWTYYLAIRSYPALLIFTAYGLGLTGARRWTFLHQHFDTLLDRSDREPTRAIETLFLLSWSGHWNWMQFQEDPKPVTPFSNHLFDLFVNWAKRFVGLPPNLELLFDSFELLGSLAHLESQQKSSIRQQLAQNRTPCMPVGRAGWDKRKSERLIQQTRMVSAVLLEAGIAKGDPELIDLFVESFERIAHRMWLGRPM